MAEPHQPVVTDGDANFVENATVHADADAQSYVHGSMPLNEQNATYGLFMNLIKWGSLGVAALVLFLTLWFHPGGNLMAAFICTAVLIAGGVFALKSKPEHAL